MKNETEILRAMEKYADTVRRICFMYLKDYNDIEDTFQDVFIKYLTHEKKFEDDEHEKAWIIRVTINKCKDFFKSFSRRNVTSLDEVKDLYSIDEYNREILDSVLKLPKKYKAVIYLHYYEGYTAVEIAKILKKSENTIYTWLSRGRQELKGYLAGDEIE